MNYILDTNTIIYFLKGMHPSIERKMRNIPAKDIYIPTIVAAELEFGARNSVNYEKSIGPIRKFLQAFKSIDFDMDAAQVYGVICADLKKSGEIIGGNDLLIAAIALQKEAILVTNNVNEFSRVENLLIEDWSKDEEERIQ